MSTGHLIGYAGGLAVALGVGAAVILNAPTASADASSATSTSSGHSGTAKTARVTQRTNTVASMRRAPTRKASAPTPSATLLIAATGATDARRTAAGAIRPPAAVGNTLSVTTDYDADNKPVTLVGVVDATGAQIGTRIVIEGTPGTPAYSTDGQHAVITTAFDESDYKSTSHLAVINTVTGAQVGTTLTFTGDSTFAPPLIVTADASQVLTVGVLYGSGSFARLVDTTGGAWEGFFVRGYPDRAPQLASDGVHALITTVYYDADLGDTLVTVMDTATGTPASISKPTVRVDGLQDRAPIVTADGHAVITTAFTDSATGVVSSRVAIFDATTGRQIGTTQTLAGTILDSPPPTLDGDSVVIHTSTGATTTIDLATGAARTMLPQWHFNPAGFWNTRIGEAVYSGLLVAGFLGSAIMAFYVLPAILWVPAAIGDTLRTLGLLPAAEAAIG